MQDWSIGVSLATAMLVCGAFTDKLPMRWGFIGAGVFLAWNYFAQPFIERRGTKR